MKIINNILDYTPLFGLFYGNWYRPYRTFDFWNITYQLICYLLLTTYLTIQNGSVIL